MGLSGESEFPNMVAPIHGAMVWEHSVGIPTDHVSSYWLNLRRYSSIQ